MSSRGSAVPKLLLGVFVIALAAGFRPSAGPSEAEDTAWSARCDLARMELQLQREGHISSSFAKPAVNRATVSHCGVRGL